MNWDNVEMIRNAQASNKRRFDEQHILVQDSINELVKTETYNQIAGPRLTELESMLFKMRSELIDYIVAHGLVDGLLWDGVLQPVESGKIVITSDMIDYINNKLGYYKEGNVKDFIEKYLPEHNYISDADYVHTDNNYTTEEKTKLEGIENGAEVNKIIDILFNGTTVLDNGTRVATITITPEDIKKWYESNPNTNVYTDAEKTKLAGISDGAEVNRVDDVLVNGRSVLDENKKAKITKEIVKQAYEENPNTNAYTDAEKTKLEEIEEGAEVNKVNDVTLNGETILDDKKTAILTSAIIKEAYEANENTNAFTDALKTKLEALQNYDIVTAPASSITELDNGEDNQGHSGLYAVTINTTITLEKEDGTKDVRDCHLTGVGIGDRRFLTGGEMFLACTKFADSNPVKAVFISGDYELKPYAKIFIDRSIFAPETVGIKFNSFEAFAPAGVLDVTVDGANVNYTENETAINIQLDRTLANYVPYSGATADISLADHDLSAQTLKANNVELDNGGYLGVNSGTADDLAKLYITPSEVTTDYNGELLPVQVAPPIKDNHATTKAYVETVRTSLETEISKLSGGKLNYYSLTYNSAIKRPGNVVAPGIDPGSVYLNITGTINSKTITENVEISGAIAYQDSGYILDRCSYLAKNNSFGIVYVTVGTVTTTSVDFSIAYMGDAELTSINSYTLAQKVVGIAGDSAGGYMVANGKQINLITGTPTKATHAATKAYVDSAVSSGGAVETVDDISEADIIKMTVNTTVDIAFSGLRYCDLSDKSYSQVNSTFTLTAGDTYLFLPCHGLSTSVRWKTAPMSATDFHSLYINSAGAIGVHVDGGIWGAYNAYCRFILPTFNTITSGDIAANTTLTYYKFK